MKKVLFVALLSIATLPASAQNYQGWSYSPNLGFNPDWAAPTAVTANATLTASQPHAIRVACSSGCNVVLPVCLPGSQYFFANSIPLICTGGSCVDGVTVQPGGTDPWISGFAPNGIEGNGPAAIAYDRITEFVAIGTGSGCAWAERNG